MKTLLIVLLPFFISSILVAQDVKLIVSGTIEFERVVNMHAIFKKSVMSDREYSEYKNSHPQFLILNSILHFANNQTLFLPSESSKESISINSNTPFPFANQNNVVYINATTKTSISQKRVFEKTFLVKNETGKIKWKITDEFREIAGYTCRRANGIIMDSVYLVAFYTNEIHISSGPESFTGLPGMILQIALPHDNVMWRATRVSDKVISDSIPNPPRGIKEIDSRQFHDIIISAMKNMDSRIKNLLMKDFLL